MNPDESVGDVEAPLEYEDQTEEKWSWCEGEEEWEMAA